MTDQTLFFIGLGNMGHPMALNLIAAGYDVIVHDLDAARGAEHVARGARWADTLAEGAREADMIMTSLPAPPEVAAVYLGDDGLLAHAKDGATLIDTTTSSVEMARELDGLARARGLTFIEAPITNAIDGAERGELAFFVGGDEEVFESWRPVFDVLGTDLFFTGGHGNGAITKLITNLLWFINAASIGEGLMIAARAEIPLETVWEAIKTSAGDSWVAQHDVPSIFAGHYDPSFTLELCCKDLRLVHEIAEGLEVPLTMGQMARGVFERAKRTYGADAPELSVVRLLEEEVGVWIRPDSDQDAAPSKEHAPRQPDLMAQAHEHMPQGVAENYRYWGDDRTVFVKHAKGCRITDADGKSYVDFRLGYGPIILGYGDARVDGAVVDRIHRGGTLTGFATPLDAVVVQQIKRMCPNIDKMRFANSGTEAVMGAVRTARGFTGRDRVVLFEGSFHGLYDEMMWKADVESWDPAGPAPRVIPFGGGIPASARDLVDLLQLNDSDGLRAYFAERGEQLACVVLEPIIGNCGSISASPEWLGLLRELCTEHGAMLLIDEVKTGFRVARGGAQELYGVHADLTTYAKAMGNGYAVAAFGGRREVMDAIGSGKGGVVHGGTYTGNLVGLSAANATLDVLEKTDALDTIARVGGEIRDALGRALDAAGVAHRFAGPPAMFGVHFGEVVPTNYRDWRRTDASLYEAFAWNLIDAGVMLEPDSREPWFICEAHQTMDLSWFEEVATGAIRAALDASAKV